MIRHLRALAGAVLLPLLVLAGCAALTGVRSPPGTTTTVVLIRHADRILLSPELSEEGRARAAALPAAVADLKIDAIYSPDTKRNLDTVRPLADQRGITVKTIGLSDVAARLVTENPGKTVLWVGNKGNLETIYGDLGGEGPPPAEYGELYVVTVRDRGPPAVSKRHFGK